MSMTQAERDAEDAIWAKGAAGRAREKKYIEADAEFLRRGLAIGSWKVRGGHPKDRFIAVVLKEVSRGGVHKKNLEKHHDNLDALKDLIDAAATETDIDAIDVTDNVHWP